MTKLIVFLKNPVAGRVKTRLAESLGDAKALEVYQWLVDLTLNCIRESDIETILYFNETSSSFRDNQHKCQLQIDGDLGEKMKSAIKENLIDGPVILIGSDCPDLLTEHLEEAAEFLKYNDIVIGPAKDGGFYLIGMQMDHTSVLDNVQWSTDQVVVEMIENINKENLSVTFIEELSDIDDIADFLPYSDQFEKSKSINAVKEKS